MTILCDIAGCYDRASRYWIAINEVDLESGQFEDEKAYEREIIDLCPHHIKKLARTIDKYLGTEVEVTRAVTVEPCPCGHSACKTYYLKGIGHFPEGSGFSLEEAERIARLINEDGGV